MADIKYKITKHIGILSEGSKGWTKELNLISWNDREPKYDIREWSPEHEKMGKGVTLSDDEAMALKYLLDGSMKCMPCNITFIKWFNSWDKDYSNIELGLSDHSVLKGLVEINDEVTFEMLDDKDFFEGLQIPKLYEGTEPERGEICCSVGKDKYHVVYYYKNKELQIIDESRTVLKFSK